MRWPTACRSSASRASACTTTSPTPSSSRPEPPVAGSANRTIAMNVSLDTLFTAETPEGIALALRPAGVAPRFYAFAIDLGIRFAILMAAVTVLAALGRMGTGVFLILYFALEWFYPVVFELGLAGATPGKRSLGLRVVMDTGLPVTPAASLLRSGERRVGEE